MHFRIHGKRQDPVYPLPSRTVKELSPNYSVPVETYGTTDAVIRYARDSGDIGELGPPDTADSSHASWAFFEGNSSKELLSVSMLVKQDGGAFVTTLDVEDNEQKEIEDQSHGNPDTGATTSRDIQDVGRLGKGYQRQ
jgi:hypothetical protein